MSILIKNVCLLNRVVKDVFIVGNRIEKIGKDLRVFADEEIDGKGKVILPGLINMHTHSAMTLFRGYADDMPLERWLKEKIWPMEQKLTFEDVYWGAKLACLEMIKTGTTTFVDNYWFTLATAKAVEEMGLRAFLASPFFDFFEQNKRKEAIQETERVLESSKNFSDRVKITLGPHSIYTVSEQGLRWIREYANTHHLFIQIHLSETEQEVEECRQRYSKHPVEFLDSLGFIDKNVICAHCLWLTEKEMEILAEKGAGVVYNPSSNMKLSSGIFDYPCARKKGVRVCLGTDGCASNNNLDMFEEMKIGALLQKLKGAENLPADECLDLAIRKPAECLGLEMGIEEGKLADVILLDLRQCAFTPGYNLTSDIVYSASGLCVSELICDGKVLMREGKVKGEEEILEKVKEVARDLINR